MRTQHRKERLPEQQGYLPVPGAHLYTVLHPVTDPVARVLLVGSFASERHLSYQPWVRWARYLAARRIEVLRYDYRGLGESTGVFEDMTFGHWNEDVQFLVDWFTSQSPNIPLVLHGLELGAIFAGKSFHEGMGDALLLWSPPASANEALRSTLLQWAGLKQLYESPENRTTATEYIRRLEQGSSIEVQGYQWPSHLWSDSFDFRLPSALGDESNGSLVYQRPVRIKKLGKEASPLVKPFRGYLEVNDFGWLYSETFDWIVNALALSREGHEAEN